MNRYDYYCTSCVNAGKDGEAKDDEVCWSCIAMGGIGNYLEKKTNADRLRAMSDEELAEAICRLELLLAKQGHRGFHAWLDWLRQEAVQDARDNP